ncbi:MAG: VOC family protein [Rhodobacteraceae bacterium]|nr:VOC family protein [Paracoccaceae bacterium]
MPIPFDHFVLLVQDLDQAARDFAALGFTVQTRADTEHGKAEYRFICFDDGSYLLLTAFTSPEAQATHRLGEVLAVGEGWADWSFTVPDAKAAAAALAAAGLPTRGPVAVSNVIADGSKWALELLMCGRGCGGDVCLPFVVSDVEGRSARIPAPKPHANGATGLVGLSLSTADATTVGRTLALLGGTQTARGQFDFGKVRVEVLPLDTPQGRPGGGMVKAVLSGSTAREFDIAQTHGAPLAMIRA